MNGTKKSKLIGLDTNLFIYYFQGSSPFGPLARNLFTTLYAGELSAVTSVITLIELLALEAPTKKIKALKEAFPELPNLTIFNVDQKIGVEAAQIRREYNLKIPDALQLATATCARADLFITNDKRLKKFKEIPVNLLTEFKQSI